MITRETKNIAPAKQIKNTRRTKNCVREINHDYKGKQKKLAHVKQMRLQGEQLQGNKKIIICGTNTTTRGTNN
jgi:hypothetical protein